MILLLLIFIQIFLESSSDAFYYKANRTTLFNWKFHSQMAHFCKGTEVLIWILFAKYSCEYFIQWRLYDDWRMEWFCFAQLIFAYACVRFGIFNTSFNLQIKQRFDHLGTGNWTDKAVEHIFPFFNQWAFRLFIFACGIIDILHLTNVLSYN
jgi:hypothetical protein